MAPVRLVLLVAALAACGGASSSAREDRDSTPSSPPALIVRVAVMLDGRLLADGREVSLQQLDQVFTELAAAEGAVWYYREGAEREPPARQRRAIAQTLDLVIRHRLPVSLSSKPDFSDYIDTAGVSRPRAWR